MRALSLLALLLVVALAAGCGGGETAVDTTGEIAVETTGETAAETTAPATDDTATDAGVTAEEADEPALTQGHVVIEKRGGGEPANVIVEIAETQQQQQQGLMFREVLAPNNGMIFAFDGERTGGFWMKNTLIPLSIAFYGENGRILKILDMEPCEADPCRIYDPGVAYVGALEVNKGAFRHWGVKAGDRIVLHRL